jgi:hypothetical protein
MRDSAFQIGAALYGLWIGGIVLSLILMLTKRPAAQPVLGFVLFGSIGVGLVFAALVIARSAGAL